MRRESDKLERPRGYYACAALMLTPLVVILLLPVFIQGLDQLPYAILMMAFVLIPFLGCGLPLRGRPLFQFHYHGEPFGDEVMDISEDERTL